MFEFSGESKQSLFLFFSKILALFAEFKLCDLKIAGDVHVSSPIFFS